MCGILGHFSFDGSQPDVALWRRLTGLLAHRGPDGEGLWHDGPFVFGHRRLSIIDLSDNGRQPMATSDAALVVTFNGEIYNYIELREELASKGHQFRSASDTEVLLHGYREWGVELPSHLIGMFAFALADRRSGELFAARDRFGEKPFMYFEDPRGVSFASELKVLAALPGLAREVDEGALGAYLCLNYVPGDATMMRGVRRLRPGTWRLWTEAGAVREHAFWTPPDPREDPLRISESEALDRLEHLLDRSTRLSLRSDVPVGIFLSGGIDSSLVARSAARAGRLARAYCLTFAEASYNEWPGAERTASQLGVPLSEVRLGPEALSDFLRLVEHADDPLADSSSLAVWTIARAAARESKVVLSGDGGDELFGGYLTYPATLWHSAITSRLPAFARRGLAFAAAHIRTNERKVSGSYKMMRFLRAANLSPAVAHFTWNGTWLPLEAAALAGDAGVRRAAEESLARLAACHDLPARPGLRDLQTADVTDYLPNDILTKSDRMSMAHGLEVRAPFLEPSLGEFALRLPAALKVSRTGATKRLLRKLAERTCGARVAGAPKQGFSIPVHSWLRGPARWVVDDLLSRKSLEAIPQLDASNVARAVDDHMSGRRSLGWELWGLAVLAAWHRAYIQSAPSVTGAPTLRLFRS